MQINPKVSIVIIAYNEERFIKDAIESALSQTYENVEVILIDDGSKDNTVAIAKQYEPRVKVISQKNSGNCSFPRNAGLELAQGEYVSFLDGDDILMPTKIQRQVDMLQKFPNAALVVSNYCNFKGDVEFVDHFSTCPRLSSEFGRLSTDSILLEAGVSADIMLDENFTIASSPLFKTAAVKNIGGFCTELFACEDYHLNYRLAYRFPMIVDRKILFKRRFHDSNMSSNSIKMSRFYFKSRWLLLLEEEDFQRRERLKAIVRRCLVGFMKSSLRLKNFSGVRESILYLIKLKLY